MVFGDQERWPPRRNRASRLRFWSFALLLLTTLPLGFASAVTVVLTSPFVIIGWYAQVRSAWVASDPIRSFDYARSAMFAAVCLNLMLYVIAATTSPEPYRPQVSYTTTSPSTGTDVRSVSVLCSLVPQDKDCN